MGSEDFLLPFHGQLLATFLVAQHLGAKRTGRETSVYLFNTRFSYVRG